MGSSDKRRDGGPASQALRSSHSNTSGGGGGGGGVIAPLPRVQLGASTPSPGAETEGAAGRAHFDSDRASSMSKDTAPARDREGQQQLQLLRDKDDRIAELQRELVAVISKYVSVNPDDIKVSMERQDNLEVLEVKIELPEAGR